MRCYSIFCAALVAALKVLRYELRTLPLSKVGSIMTDSYDNGIPPHNCKWGHLIRLYIFSALGNVT